MTKIANVNVSIAGKEIVINRKNFSRLAVDRNAKDVSDSFTLEVLDDDASTLESLILAGNNDISITYFSEDLEDLEAGKTLSGNILKISTAFVDNRQMLSISGLVSIGVKDKYEKYSVSWNVVPKFKMSDVLGVAKTQLQDENFEYDAGLDQFWQMVKKSWNDSFSVWYDLAILFNSEDELASEANYKDIIDNIFANNWISLDSQGNYYLQKYRKTKSMTYTGKGMDSSGNYDQEDSEKYTVKSEGSYIIPMKPDKILKLIFCGGKFSDLLEKEYTDYKGTSFYTEDISNADWYFIKKWYDMMGTFPGLGYTEFIKTETSWCETELNQVRQSFFEYIYHTLLNKMYVIKDGKIYTNFYLSFEDKTVKLKRLDASANPKDIPEYIYYGKFNDSGRNKGRMISFSPTTDILTSLIAGQSAVDSSADISTTNLITDKTMEDITITKAKDNLNEKNAEKTKNDKVVEGRYNVKWGAIKIASSSKTEADADLKGKDIVKVFENAAKLAYKAEAVIDGYNNLSPQEYIKITILPASVNGGTSAHHYSGTYFILSISDEISNGKFVSKLKLIKNINAMGDTAQVNESINDQQGEQKFSVSPEVHIKEDDPLIVKQAKMNQVTTY